MSSIPYDVASAFSAGRPARRGEFRSTGDALYSYGVRLAHHDENGAIVLDVTREWARERSATTNRHFIALEGVLGRNG